MSAASTSGLLASYQNIIDADGHILEPLNTWEKYIDPQFRDRAIRIRRDAEGNEYLEFDGRPAKFFNLMGYKLLGAMGHSSEEIAAIVKKPYEECVPFGSMNPKERVQLLDQEGLAATILYPSVWLTWECDIDDPALADAYARAYNRGDDRFFWATDYPHFDHPGNYLDALENLVTPLSETARRNLLGDSVAQVYGLG